MGRGGFSLKFIVLSGVKPCDKASSDKETVKMLGYKWTTEPDLISLGLGELNLKKKIRESSNKKNRKKNDIRIPLKDVPRQKKKKLRRSKKTKK